MLICDARFVALVSLLCDQHMDDTDMLGNAARDVRAILGKDYVECSDGRGAIAIPVPKKKGKDV